jgi:hypothetical protein
MATKEKKEVIGRVKLKNVRIAFADVYVPKEGKVDEKTGKKGEAKYAASFLIPKEGDADDKANLTNLKKAKEAVMKAKWPGKDPSKSLKPEKLCTRDGDLEPYDGYEGMFYVSSSNKDQPVLIDCRKGKDGKWMPAAPGRIYGGCYVNAIVTLWAQDNEHGKRVNASLEAVQFLRDGETFGKGRIDADSEFDDDDAFGDEADITADEDEDEDVDALI